MFNRFATPMDPLKNKSGEGLLLQRPCCLLFLAIAI